jgi:hypothetical protein
MKIYPRNITPSKTTHVKEPIQIRFNHFDKENPKVYEHYKSIALRLLKSGKKRIGSKAIVERLRWDVDFQTKGEHFKICNDFTPYYARKFMKEFPEHKDKFSIRPLKA